MTDRGWMWVGLGGGSEQDRGARQQSIAFYMNYSTYFTELRWKIYKYDHVNLCDSFNLFQSPYVLLRKEENSFFAIQDPPSKISKDHLGNYPAKSIILVRMKIVVNSITNLKYSEV